MKHIWHFATRIKTTRRNRGFKSIVISLTSPEDILEKSSGEALKPETINYRTHKPERTVCFVRRSSDLSRIMSVSVASTSASVTAASSATAAVLKSQRRKSVGSALDTLFWWFR